MACRTGPGFGELLRYVGELVDQGAEAHYRAAGLEYRPRFTPVLRAISAGARTVTDITAHSYLTQGAISQTVKLLQDQGLVARHSMQDGRMNGVHLTPRGEDLLAILESHWEAIFSAVEALEQEIGHPLLSVLADAARALEQQGFAERLRTAATKLDRAEQADDD